MTGIRVAVYESDTTTFIANVPRRRNVRWLDEVNSPGTGQFDIRLNDLILSSHPTLLDDGNVVRFYLGATLLKAWRIESRSPVRVSSGEDADRWQVVSGRGPGADLENAVVYPEYGLRELVSEDRWFNFSSIAGSWYTSGEWVTPVGVQWKNDTTGRAGFPKAWTDKTAKWLWSSDPNSASLPGANWFRTSFTLTDSTPVIVYASADNKFKAYMDGVLILSSGHKTNAWRKRYAWRMTLAAGDHVFAAEVENLGGGAQSTNSNPAGFIATIYRSDDTGGPTADNVLRTDTTNTLVRPYGAPPGWVGATILQQLVQEAQDRNVDALLPVTFSFTVTADSAGVAWSDEDRFDRSVKVATTDLADLTQQIVELGLDVEVDANWVMHCWKKRGIDKTATVRLLPNRDVTSASATILSQRVRNHGLIKFSGGWIEVYSANSKSTYGRREIGISLGTSGSSNQAVKAATAALRETLEPEKTIPLSYTSVAGDQPYTDFDLGDVIVVPDETVGLFNGRLMSIAGSEEGDSGVIHWDLDFYPDTSDTDDIKTVVTATGGSYEDISSLYKNEVLSDSPWGYWRLSETSGTTFKDKSSRNVDLTMYWPGSGTTNKPTLGIAGPVSSGAAFNATTGSTPDGFFSAHATSNVSGNKLFDYKNATFEIWIKRLSSPSAKTAVLQMQTATTVQWELGVGSAGKAYFQFVDTNDNVITMTSTNALSSTSWTHVVGAVGPGDAKLFINGALDQHVTSGWGTPRTVGYNLVLRGDLTGNAFSVQLAEPAVYFQALTNARVLSHFRAARYTP